ncbi:MAG: hypothetical protein ACOX8A_12065 [Thermacetogeniaceae bacterium]|jgi:hypothetical protein
MIGNSYLQGLFEYTDEDTSFNQLLEFLAYKDIKFIDSLWGEPIDLDSCTEEEIVYLTKASALIDYYLQVHGMEAPGWLRDERLCFEKPYYHSKRLSDFEKVRLMYTNPAPFRARNVYFDLDGIKRV